MVTNYWSIGGSPVFFDDFEEQSIIRAYDHALLIQRAATKVGDDGKTTFVPPLSSYRPRIIEGQWSGVPSLFTDSELPPRFAASVKEAA